MMGIKGGCQKGLMSQNRFFKRMRYDLTEFETGFSQKR